MRKLNKKIILCVMVIVVFAIGVYFFIEENYYGEEFMDVNIADSNVKTDNIDVNEIDEVVKKEKIVVYITGAVRKEGVFEVDENSRIADVIERAEGLTEDANIEGVNLAYILEDGMKVHIPRKGESDNVVNDNTDSYVSKGSGSVESSKNVNVIAQNGQSNQNIKSDKVNINTATQTELESLPGVGPSTAIKIIEYRKENGKFKSVEDIKNVSGIGEAKFAKMKDFVKV